MLEKCRKQSAPVQRHQAAEPEEVEILDKDTTIAVQDNKESDAKQPIDLLPARNDGGGRYNLRRNPKTIKRNDFSYDTD